MGIITRNPMGKIEWHNFKSPKVTKYFSTCGTYTIEKAYKCWHVWVVDELIATPKTMRLAKKAAQDYKDTNEC